MPQKLVLTPEGAWLVDAPDQATAQTKAAQGQGTALRLDSPQLQTFPEPIRLEVEQHLGRLGDSAVVREAQRRQAAPGVFSRLLNLGARAAPSVVGEELAGQTARLVKPQLELPARSLGAMSGEAVRQVFLAPNSEPLDVLEILAAGAIPFKGPVAGKVARGLGLAERTVAETRQARIRLLKGMPGAGVALLEEARDQIATIPARIRRDADDLIQVTYPGQTWDSLRAQAFTHTTPLPMRHLQGEAKALLRDEDLAAAFGAELGGKAARIARAAEGTPLGTVGGTPVLTTPSATLEQLDVVRQNLGGLIGQARAAGNKTVEERFRGLFAGLMQDLDTAIAQGVPGAHAYKTSLEATRREMAAQALEDALTKFSRPVRGETFESLNIGQLYKDFQRSLTAHKAGRPRGFTSLPDLLSAAEKKEILSLLEFWNESLPALPTRMTLGGSGANVGSGQLIFRSMLGSGLAAGLNRMAGDVIPPAMAAAAGVAIPALWGNMLMSETGRRLLREYITHGGPINLTELAVRWAGQGGRVGLFDVPSVQETSEQLLGPFQAPRLESAR